MRPFFSTVYIYQPEGRCLNTHDGVQLIFFYFGIFVNEIEVLFLNL